MHRRLRRVNSNHIPDGTPVVITAIIVFVVSGVLTFINIGWRYDFVIRWCSAFAIGWPIAAGTAYLAIPFARSLTQRIVAAIERT